MLICERQLTLEKGHFFVAEQVLLRTSATPNKCYLFNPFLRVKTQIFFNEPLFAKKNKKKTTTTTTTTKKQNKKKTSILFKRKRTVLQNPVSTEYLRRIKKNDLYFRNSIFFANFHEHYLKYSILDVIFIVVHSIQAKSHATRAGRSCCVHCPVLFFFLYFSFSFYLSPLSPQFFVVYIYIYIYYFIFYLFFVIVLPLLCTPLKLYVVSFVRVHVLPTSTITLFSWEFIFVGNLS